MLINVNVPSTRRTEVAMLVDMFHARVVDIGQDHMMIEISGQEQKIEAFIDLMRPFGIKELARTGRIALVRSRPWGDDA
jgi:acetolactate synthase-1/3 small subunit